jgi:hypothetical protein
VLTVADEKTGSGRKPKSGDAELKYSTFRLYADDAEDLSDLAGMEGKTVADLYRELCAPLIRRRRIQRTEEKLKRLKEPKD